MVPDEGVIRRPHSQQELSVIFCDCWNSNVFKLMKYKLLAFFDVN